MVNNNKLASTPPTISFEDEKIDTLILLARRFFFPQMQDEPFVSCAECGASMDTSMDSSLAEGEVRSIRLTSTKRAVEIADGPVATIASRAARATDRAWSAMIAVRVETSVVG